MILLDVEMISLIYIKKILLNFFKRFIIAATVLLLLDFEFYEYFKFKSLNYKIKCKRPFGYLKV